MLNLIKFNISFIIAFMLISASLMQVDALNALNLFQKSISRFNKASLPALGQDDNLFDSVIKVFCVHTPPDYSMPWQRYKQESSSSSGFVIDKNRIVTNAHAVEYGSLIQVSIICIILY